MGGGGGEGRAARGTSGTDAGGRSGYPRRGEKRVLAAGFLRFCCQKGDSSQKTMACNKGVTGEELARWCSRRVGVWTPRTRLAGHVSVRSVCARSGGGAHMLEDSGREAGALVCAPVGRDSSRQSGACGKHEAGGAQVHGE